MSNFPVQNNAYNSFEEYATMEGIFYPVGQQTSQVIWTGQASAGGMGIGAETPHWNVDNAYYMKSLTLSSNVSFLANLISYFNDSNIGVSSGNVLVKDAVSIPMGIVRKQGQTAISYAITDVPEANPSSTQAIVNQFGFIVTKGQTTPVNTNLKTYSLPVTLTNFSGSTSTGSLVITDTLPTGCSFVAVSGSAFTFTQSGSTYTATTTSSIANNGSLSYNLTVKGTLIMDIGFLGMGYTVPNDMDYNLRPSVWAGTSISAGTGISTFNQNYTGMMKIWLNQNLNINVRTLNRAISGCQTNTMEYYRAYNNFYDFKVDPKFFWIEHGVNDISQNIPTATSVANVTAMINYIRKKYPTCYIMILVSFPCGDAPTEAGLVTYRAAMQTLVNSYPATDQVYLKYIAGTGTAWNAATQSGLYTTDNVHANPAGRILIFNAITNYITTNGLTFL